MNLIPHGIFGAVVVFIIGFYVAKKWPGLFSAVPLVNQVL